MLCKNYVFILCLESNEDPDAYVIRSFTRDSREAYYYLMRRGPYWPAVVFGLDLLTMQKSMVTKTQLRDWNIE